ncbi:MAG: phenylalanine--tRNA ligase subunit beta [Defluviitaleaceae bacterium]|nr:phenylalanine--tRNA ligase subunit beta [Defluviitaleaceae bacterium]
MKLSLNWLKEYVDLPNDLEKIAYDLTMATVEVEGWEDLTKQFDKIVMGVVLELSAHPNADKLTLCKVDIGGGDVKEIVCGGCNLRVGMKVAVSLPGAMVRWHGVGDLVEIKKSKVRGVESFGMICASSEIGLFDLFPFTDEATIVDLTDFEAAAGTNIAVALGIDDIILEIDNKSLTNRPDLWGHYGIARELSAFYGLELKAIAPFVFPENIPEIDITLEDPLRSARYIGVQIEGLNVKASPFEIQSRLWRVGLRPINAIVDITNLVMLATGQPTHAFDCDRIHGHITVRRAKESEKLLLLDDKELSLTTEDLVIADDEGSVGLAGVMGGKRDSVLDETSRVILEIANFDAIGIRRTASRYDSRTDAAIRFEKGIDPERADLTLPLAMKLFADLFPDMKITGFRDNYAAKLGRKKIDVSLSWLENRLGKRLPQNNITQTLELLGFDVKFDGDTLHAVAPTWRSTGDISIPDDIMEELARMHGYENFEAAPIETSFTQSINQISISIDRNIREYFAFRCGMREIMTYPWVKDDFLHALYGENIANCITLSAPPSPDEKNLRTSLLPNICKAISGNVRYFNEFSIFESAQIFLPGDFVSEYDPREKLPIQQKSFAGAFVGEDVNTLFRTAKGALENLPRCVHIHDFSFDKIEKPSWADNTVWLNIIHSEKNIGTLALLSKKAALSCGIKNNSVMLFEFNLDALKPFASRENKFAHLSDYPMTEYDLSLLFDSSVKWTEISAVILAKKGDGDILRAASFVDEYRGKQIPDGKKSITFRLQIGSFEKTLTSNEIETFANSVVKRLSKQLGAEIRDK